MNNLKVLQEIIHPEVEPGVINTRMIEDSIQADGFKGEAGRLQSLEFIEYNKVETIRLEFKNILRIDHLWVLPNLTKLSLNFNKIEKIENIEMLTSLKELDLSFNYIEKIENLDALVNLEVLTLFNNSITKIENMDALDNLVILSLGNNQISTLNGLERFRFLSKLNVLNLEGNPISEDKEQFRLYVAAFFPKIKYYEYVYISDEERQIGKDAYVRELRELEGNEQDEIELRAKQAKELADEIQLSSSFVEHLNEHQLFDSLFDGDADGSVLMMIGEEAADIREEFKNDMYVITQEIYKLGLLKYEERQEELRLFNECIQAGKTKAQKKGQKVIEEFMEFKNKVFANAREHLVHIERLRRDSMDDRINEIPAHTAEVATIADEYYTKLDDIWKSLMEDEVQIFETIEEAISEFERNINGMMQKFLEQIQIFFISLRDVAFNFSENLFEAVSRYITDILASGKLDKVPQQLKICFEDKEAVENLVGGMREFQGQKIDIREEKLMARGQAWVTNLIEEMRNNELQRNRTKITEINFYLDQMRESFEDLQDEAYKQVQKESNV